MTDHATRAREIVNVLEGTLASMLADGAISEDAARTIGLTSQFLVTEIASSLDLAAQPVWSKDKPTVGLWLHRAMDGDVTTGKVVDWRGDGDLYFRDAFGQLNQIDDVCGEWAPITLPREA